MSNSTFSKLLRESFKSDDTEEWLDVHFTRPIGLAFALMWRRLHVHPNFVTLLGIVLGAAAGVMFYFVDIWYNVAGVILLMFANFCDSTDGQLARLTGQKTLVGRILDGFSSDVWFFFIYMAIVLRIWNDPIPLIGLSWGIVGFVMCAFAGFVSHTNQCLLSDYYRQIHLYFLLGKNGSELDDSKTQWDVYNSLPQKGAFMQRTFYYNYAKYCARQEKRTPMFQAFFKNVKREWPNAEDMPRGLRDEFRAGSLPLMKYTNLLTFNTRAITLYLSCLLNVPYVYPLVEIFVFFIIYTYMHKSHEALCERLDKKYFR